MPDLIAQGPLPKDRWRRPLPTVVAGLTPIVNLPTITIGRSGSETSGMAGGFSEGVIGGLSGGIGWAVPWDDRISRRHVLLRAEADGSLLVEKLPEARNPVFYRGVQSDRFELQPGEHFVIGQTTFTLATRPAVSQAEQRNEVTEHVYQVRDLRGRRFRDAASRIDALGRLPDIIGGSTNDDELLVRIVSLLLQSIPSAAAVAILDASGDESRPPEILHYDNRMAETGGPRPSARIARQSLRTMENVLHLWSGGETRDDAAHGDDRSENSPENGREGAQGGGQAGGQVGGQVGGEPYTASEGVDWAFCVPLPTASCPGWVIYVTGQLLPRVDGNLEKTIAAAPDDLQDDIKFTEIVGTTLGNLRQSRLLQRQQLGLQRFFSPVVVDALAGRDADEVLQPREADVSVIFCDLRGFTRQSEQAQDRLLELLQRVSEALGVMTGEILRLGGVVGDFHGDAAMGFWGWPLDQPDAPLRAAQAALTIREAFFGAVSREVGSDKPSGFRCGIGIATGRAVAGRIGTTDQVKVTAFGPVVNLASRLEGMTKTLGAEVLLDQTTADWLRRNVSADIVRTRRLVRVRPAGIVTPINVYQLLRPVGQPSAPSDQDVRAYELALDALSAGDWDQAFDYLHQVSASDRAKDFLTATILRNGRTPPPHWDGVIDVGK